MGRLGEKKAVGGSEVSSGLGMLGPRRAKKQPNRRRAVRLFFSKLFLAFSTGSDRRGSFENAGSALRAAKGAPEGEIFDHRARVGAGEAPGAGLSRSRTVVSFLDKTLSKTPYAGRKNKMLIVILQA